MATQVRLVDKIQLRLVKLGLSRRKATTVALGLAPTAQRAKVSGTVTSKLVGKLLALGLTERKAVALAKGLAPTVRANIKAKAKTAQRKLAEVDDAEVNAEVLAVTDGADDGELDAVAPRVNGHRVRLDLPVVARSAWQRFPIKGIELLRVMDGLTTVATYLVAAVYKDAGIVAVRQLGSNYYNVKFYPTMAYWNESEETLRTLGGQEFLTREWYERCHVNQAGLDLILKRLTKRQKPVKVNLLDRFRTVSVTPLLKAFGFLQKRLAA